jgi:benzil reductase ((S)-benzoin forming)
MNYYIITGTSRGLGKAFVEALLKDEQNFVFGISREQTIHHSRYKHLSLDLSDSNVLKNLQLPIDLTANKLVLINNAGRLGDIKHVPNLDVEDVVTTYLLNNAAPVVLSSLFLSQTNHFKGERIIINISSGAAHRPIDGWSVYCSSKSGLDMFTKVVNEELKLSGNHENTRCFSIAPGVVDTNMQQEIRSAESENFSSLQTFKDFKNNDELVAPNEVAKKIITILTDWKTIQDAVFSVRDY